MRPLSPKHVRSMFAHWSTLRLIDLLLILLGEVKRQLELSSKSPSKKVRP